MFAAAPIVSTVVFDAATHAPWTGAATTGASAFDTSTVTGDAQHHSDRHGHLHLLQQRRLLRERRTGGHGDIDQLWRGAQLDYPGPPCSGHALIPSHYSGNDPYTSSTSPCEPFNVDPGTSKVVTTVADQSTNQPVTGTETAGMFAHDTAIVTGATGVTPTGTVTYTFFTNDSCTGTGRRHWHRDIGPDRCRAELHHARALDGGRLQLPRQLQR